MIRTTTASAAALTLTLAATLTACGGGTHHGAHDKPTPAISGATSSPSASPSPSATKPDASAPPKAVLPKGFHIVVDGGKTGDPAKDAVLAANLAQYEATYQAIGRQNAEDPLYKEWTGREGVTVDAQQTAKKYIQDYVKGGWTVVGTLRISDENIASMTSKTAHLSWCENQTNMYGKVIKTGKILYTKPSRADFSYFQSTLRKDDSGRWITVWLRSFNKDARCH